MKLLFWKKSGKKEEQAKESVHEQGKEKKRLNISDLFYNNQFVMVFSLIAALILWFIMSLTNTTERPREVGDVPISVELSTAAQEENLKELLMLHEMKERARRGGTAAEMEGGKLEWQEIE